MSLKIRRATPEDAPLLATLGGESYRYHFERHWVSAEELQAFIEEEYAQATLAESLADPAVLITGLNLPAVALTAPNVQLRIDGHYHIQHDKTIIVDERTVETGSFNYAPSAETENSENEVVLRDMPDIARQYVAHWESRWELGVPFIEETSVKHIAG